MTSEEIIQRLLKEDKITVKEALIILKDLAKVGFQQVFIPEVKRPKPTTPVVVMYGVGVPTTWSDDIIPDSDNYAVSTNNTIKS